MAHHFSKKEQQKEGIGMEIGVRRIVAKRLASNHKLQARAKAFS